MGELRHADLTGRILATFYQVYNELGVGFPERVYARAMEAALRSSGLRVGREVRLPVRFRGGAVADFKADLLVFDGPILVEIKVSDDIEPCHGAQVLSYLRATDIEVGLLLNFGPRPRFKRFIFTNDRKPGSV